jgi:hypothetical protein
MFVVGLALLYTTAVASVGDSSNNGTLARMQQLTYA